MALAFLEPRGIDFVLPGVQFLMLYKAQMALMHRYTTITTEDDDNFD